MERLGLFLYLSFVISWFLRLTARFPALGAIRLDLVLIIGAFLIYLFFVEKEKVKGLGNSVYRRLLLLVIVILAITPFAEWPGSVLRTGLLNFVKAIVFFFFTVWYVRTEARVRIFITVFLVCQSIRVVEPLLLHLTRGYWGSKAYIGSGGEFMNRLSGGPYDVINPNGLAFLVLTIVPFLIYLYREGLFWRLFSCAVVPLSLYALYLTGSRSGMLGLAVILLVFFLQSKRKVVALIPIVILGVFALVRIEGQFKDRYLSIISTKAAHAGTAKGRIEGVWRDIKVGMRKPLVGHGLGTSLEANVHYGGVALVSHNLYAEIFQEIGAVGLVLFLSFIFHIFRNLLDSRAGPSFMAKLRQGALVFAWMNLFFGLASYGLSSYEWYFLAALSLILFEQAQQGLNEKERAPGCPLAGWRDSHLPQVRLPKL